ncbi:MAG: tRNA uridine-5-carboxymethylaminomethyl(34) synthesis GTPase MnmE [Blastocatellia bacterium]|nr:tRNA uridine-5-carboxymethylaminomethyl(34) synthesis GTPase MnmE [Blastocatellia bacterium]
MRDTIVALATPLGRSGIGMIRLSGADSLLLARALSGNPEFSPRPRTFSLRTLFDPATHEVIDEAIITYFKAPNSFTGEDVIEISCHGSPIVLRHVIDICLSLGARMADPGEFSLRALANGRMNLAEAEAIRDLIDAQTKATARQAIRQLEGEFSNQLTPIKDELLNVIVVLESALEFVEDDLPEFQASRIRAGMTRISVEIAQIASTYQAGKLLREGISVALVGRPNVGKSSLFNALLGTDRAIVTEIAGTTRDQLLERFTINDIPISLIDTAGLRETADTVESIGVARSRKTMADADLVVVLLDASEPIGPEDREIIESVKELDHLVVLNKIDKIEMNGKSSVGSAVDPTVPGDAIKISAKTGMGLDDLKNALIEPLGIDDRDVSGFLVSDARHFDLLNRAHKEVENSILEMDKGLSEEIVLVGLHNALRFLGQITGETTNEDMLTRIFSTFCIGK